MPESSPHEWLTTTKVLHDVETEEGAEDVDGTEDDLGDEGVLNTNRLEDGGTVVEEVVGTGELLQTLHDHTKEGTVYELASALVASKALVPATPEG